MDARCPSCGGQPAVGVLCTGCAASVTPCAGLLPPHLTARAGTADAAGWLIDGFGTPHPVAAGRSIVGRRTDAEIAVQHASVSRDHAELVPGGGGWTLRDLGSRNGTTVEGEAHTRGALREITRVRFGEVGFVFVGRPGAMPVRAPRGVETASVGSGLSRVLLRSASLELCLVSTGDDAAGGLLLHRPPGATAWTESSLPALEFRLLWLLSSRALEHARAPTRAGACVPAKQLVRTLPFVSKHASEENVRQLVHRLRDSLARVGAGAVVETHPRLGYYVAWSVSPA
jgi:hypothetical protein